jgi:hypothetical protein
MPRSTTTTIDLKATYTASFAVRSDLELQQSTEFCFSLPNRKNWNLYTILGCSGIPEFDICFYIS